MKKQKELLIIMPAYNEEKNIEAGLYELEKPEISSIADILVMNDASSDSTNWVVKAHGHTLVTHVFNLGYGSALQLGYKYAIRRKYKYVMQSEGAILMLFRWMRMGSMMSAIFQRFMRDFGRRMQMEDIRISCLDRGLWRGVLIFRFP